MLFRNVKCLTWIVSAWEYVTNNIGDTWDVSKQVRSEFCLSQIQCELSSDRPQRGGRPFEEGKQRQSTDVITADLKDSTLSLPVLRPDSQCYETC